jgi:leucyl aminopeptidase
MQISFAAPSAKVQAGSWVVAASEGRALSQAAVKADKASAGALTRAMKFSRFTGKSGELLEVLAPEGLTASRLVLVGLGKPDALDGKGLEVIGAQIVARLESAGETAAIFEIEVPKGTKIKRAPKSKAAKRQRVLRSAPGCAATASRSIAPAIWTNSKDIFRP